MRRHWEREQLADKLAPTGARDVATWFARHVEQAAARARGRTLRILALAGSGQFEVDLARRLLDAGITDFELRARVSGEERARAADILAREEGVARRVRFEAGDPSEVGPEDPSERYDVIWAHDTLVATGDPDAATVRLREVLAPDGVLLVASDLADGSDPGAAALSERIWQIVPDRYRFDHVSRCVATRLDDGSDEREVRPASRVLPALLEHFHFEAFFAYGGLVARLLGPRFGPNFEPADGRDCRFVEQLARLDDEKIDAGVLKPVRMVAALRPGPVGEPLVHRGWTPRFCLPRAARSDAPAGVGDETAVRTAPHVR